jgi:hypothetical protein
MQDGENMQQKYWNNMVQVKSSEFYLDIYLDNSYRWNQVINVFSAIASSSSIACWTIWKDFSYVWAVIIAVSQVINTIKEFFPYNKMLKLLPPFLADVKSFYIKTEKDWYNVAGGEMTEDDINTLLYSYKEEFSEIEGKYLKDDVLIEKTRYMKEADQKTELYFKNNF